MRKRGDGLRAIEQHDSTRHDCWYSTVDNHSSLLARYSRAQQTLEARTTRPYVSPPPPSSASSDMSLRQLQHSPCPFWQLAAASTLRALHTLLP